MFDTCPVMSTLRSGLDELRGEVLSSLSDGELDDRLSELARCSRGISAESARTVAEIERRGTFARDGHLCVTSFVGSRLGVGWSEAAREVRLARALEHMPAVREAFSDGEVSAAVVSTLAGAMEASPEGFARDEGSLLDAACSLPPPELRAAVDHWKARVNRDSAEREDRERFERRGLNVSPGADGMVRVDGRLDPETGGTVLTALRAVTDAWARSGDTDERSPAQLRADALGEVCRGWLDRPDRPEVGTERPHLTVVVDLQALEGGAGTAPDSRRTGPDEVRLSGTRRDTSVGTSLSPETIRRLACDAVVSRVITAGRSEPLEAGRSSRVVPPSIRRALVVRDSGCAFPVCDRPPSWCDAHHVKHWADGGPTDLGNLVLLCRRHHRLIHAGFGVEMTEGRPAFTRPDGTVIEDRAPP